jgi:hypothetical protein
MMGQEWKLEMFITNFPHLIEYINKIKISEIFVILG